MLKVTVTYQPELVEFLPQVLNNKEFEEYRRLLERIDEIIKMTGMDIEFARKHLETIERERVSRGIEHAMSERQIQAATRYAVKAYRCTLAGILYSVRIFPK